MRRRTFLASILAAGVSRGTIRMSESARTMAGATLLLGAPGVRGFRGEDGPGSGLLGPRGVTGPGPCPAGAPGPEGLCRITIPVFTGTAYWVGTDLVQPFKPEFSSSITFVGKDYADVQAQIHRYQEERHELLFGNRRDQVS